MPIKPVFERKPLTAVKRSPLYPTEITVHSPMVDELINIGKKHMDNPLMWKSMLGLSAAAGNTDVNKMVEEKITAAAAAQRENGRYSDNMDENVAAAKAVLALFTQCGNVELVKSLLLFCRNISENIETIHGGDVRTVADLALLTDEIYRITGVAAVMSLNTKLMQHSLPWDSLLNTFDQKNAVDEDSGSPVCSGEKLSDGIRTAVARVKNSSSSTYITALKNGTGKLLRYHGAVCGGITCGPALGGLSPFAQIDTGALGAFAEAMALWAEQTGETMPWEQMETMWRNAFPGAIADGEVKAAQWANKNENGDTADLASAARFMDGVCSVLYHSVCAEKDGIYVGMLADGAYNVPTKSGVVSFTVKRSAGKAEIGFSSKNPEDAVCRIRIPQWMENPWVRCEDDSAEIENGTAEVKTVGNVIITWDAAPRLVSGYHQGVYAMVEDCVLSGDKQSSKECGISQIVSGESGIFAEAYLVEKWDKKNDIPVLPKVGNEKKEIPLMPYSECSSRVTVYPKARK